MYPSYSDGIQHTETCMRAVEGDTGHVLMQSGVITLSLSANTPKSQSVTFPRIFTPNTTPHVVVSLSSIGNVNSTIKNLVGTSATNTGFTIQALSDTTQSITVTWIAKGTAQ
jgi:hypothetical protein